MDVRCDICGGLASPSKAFIQCSACSSLSNELQDCSKCHHLEDLQDIDRALREAFGPVATAGVGSVHTLPQAVRHELAQAQARIKQLEAQLETAKGLLSALNLEDDDAAWEHLQESPDAK